MSKQNAKRWGLVTLCAGITCGTAGHYLPAPLAHVVIVTLAGVIALIGSVSVEEDSDA